MGKYSLAIALAQRPLFLAIESAPTRQDNESDFNIREELQPEWVER
jgi:hypothetical protein